MLCDPDLGSLLDFSSIFTLVYMFLYVEVRNASLTASIDDEFPSRGDSDLRIRRKQRRLDNSDYTVSTWPIRLAPQRDMQAQRKSVATPAILPNREQKSSARKVSKTPHILLKASQR